MGSESIAPIVDKRESTFRLSATFTFSIIQFVSPTKFLQGQLLVQRYTENKTYAKFCWEDKFNYGERGSCKLARLFHFQYQSLKGTESLWLAQNLLLYTMVFTHNLSRFTPQALFRSPGMTSAVVLKREDQHSN